MPEDETLENEKNVTAKNRDDKEVVRKRESESQSKLYARDWSVLLGNDYAQTDNPPCTPLVV